MYSFGFAKSIYMYIIEFERPDDEHLDGFFNPLLVERSDRRSSTNIGSYMSHKTLESDCEPYMYDMDLNFSAKHTFIRSIFIFSLYSQKNIL